MQVSSGDRSNKNGRFLLKNNTVNYFCKKFHPRCFTDSTYNSVRIISKEKRQVLARPSLKEPEHFSEINSYLRWKKTRDDKNV